jgi:hypothetical protein
MENRTYMIFSSSEMGLINFNEILDDNYETMIFSLDGSKIVVKWEGNQPEFVSELKTIVGFFNKDQMLDILRTPEWLPEIFI